VKAVYVRLQQAVSTFYPALSARSGVVFIEQRSEKGGQDSISIASVVAPRVLREGRDELERDLSDTTSKVSFLSGIEEPFDVDLDMLQALFKPEREGIGDMLLLFIELRSPAKWT
jgi:hypothetical protein